MAPKTFYLKMLVLFILVGLALRITLAKSLGFFTVEYDMYTFQAWGNILANNGSGDFYNGWSDYLPGYLYVLWFITIIYKWLLAQSLLIPIDIFYKLPSILSDLGNFVFIYLIVKKFASQRWALLTGLAYLLNIVFFANSTLWGQADSFITLFLLSSFYYLLQGKYWLSALLIGFAQIVKPIAILSLPLYLIYLFHQKKFKEVIIYIAIFGTVILLLFTPFNNTNNIFQFILERHVVTANQYPYTSVNAFNFWSLVTKLWQPDKEFFLNITLHDWGTFLFGVIYLVIISITSFRLKTTKNVAFVLSFALAICYFALFTFLTRMHERHLYYGLVYLTTLLPRLSIFGTIALLILYMVHLLNLYYPYSHATSTPLILERNLIIVVSFALVAVFVYFFVTFVKNYVKKSES